MNLQQKEKQLLAVLELLDRDGLVCWKTKKDGKIEKSYPKFQTFLLISKLPRKISKTEKS